MDLSHSLADHHEHSGRGRRHPVFERFRRRLFRRCERIDRGRWFFRRRELRRRK
jgi:hypothetical protein